MFKESEHPRDAEGRFVKGAGGSKDPDLEEIAKGIFPHLRNQRKAKINSVDLTRESKGGIMYGEPIVKGVGAHSPS